MTVRIAKLHPVSHLDTPSPRPDTPAQHRPSVLTRVIVLALLFLAALMIATFLFVFSGADLREIYGAYVVT